LNTTRWTQRASIKSALKGLFIAYCTLAIILHPFVSLWNEWWRFPVSKRIAMSRREYSTDDDLHQFLFPGLRQIHGFASTLHWWHGTWVGRVPFWRPLTSYGFWFEYKLFPPNRYDEWYVVSALSNLVFCALLILFAKKLTESMVFGFFVGLLFSGSFLMSPLAVDRSVLNIFGSEFFGPPCNLAFNVWKNQPDIWSDTAIIGSLILVLDKKWAWALVCASIAVAFKENGWLTFPLIGLVLWAKHRLRSTPRKVYAAITACMIALVLIRLNCGMEVFRGYHMGHNNVGSHHGAVYRYILSTMLPYPAMFLQFAAPAVFGTLAFLGYAFKKWHPALRVALAFAGLALAVVMDVAASQIDIVTALYMEFAWYMHLLYAMTAFVWLLFASVLVTNMKYRRLILSLLIMVLLSSALMVLSTQVQSHVLYLAYAFRCVLFALAPFVLLQSRKCSKFTEHGEYTTAAKQQLDSTIKIGN